MSTCEPLIYLLQVKQWKRLEIYCFVRYAEIEQLVNTMVLRHVMGVKVFLDVQYGKIIYIHAGM